MNIRRVEQSYLQTNSAVSGLSEWIKWREKPWWHTPNEHVMWVWCAEEWHIPGKVKGGIRVTHLGVEKPPGKSQVGAGHRYCLGQHFLSMWQNYSGGWNSCFIQAQSFSICNASFSLALTHTQDHTHKRVLTHIYTHTHLPACRQSHFISINTFVLLLHLTQNRHTHCCPAYKCRKCAVNITKLGICKFHWDQQLICTLINLTYEVKNSAKDKAESYFH